MQGNKAIEFMHWLFTKKNPAKTQISDGIKKYIEWITGFDRHQRDSVLHWSQNFSYGQEAEYYSFQTYK